MLKSVPQAGRASGFVQVVNGDPGPHRHLARQGVDRADVAQPLERHHDFSPTRHRPAHQSGVAALRNECDTDPAGPRDDGGYFRGVGRSNHTQGPTRVATSPVDLVAIETSRENVGRADDRGQLLDDRRGHAPRVLVPT